MASLGQYLAPSHTPSPLNIVRSVCGHASNHVTTSVQKLGPINLWQIRTTRADFLLFKQEEYRTNPSGQIFSNSLTLHKSLYPWSTTVDVLFIKSNPLPLYSSSSPVCLAITQCGDPNKTQSAETTNWFLALLWSVSLSVSHG